MVVELAADRRHVRERLLLDVLEADDDVGHLHARVVDVVLDADVVAAVTQQAHERVAQAGVAQVADVRGLVRVDRGVLDDHVTPAGRRRSAGRQRLVHAPGGGAALEEQVEEAAPGHLGADDTGRPGEPGRELLRDLPRLAPQLLGEVEGGRQRDVAEVDPRRVLEGHRFELDAEGVAGGLADGAGQVLLDIQDHGR